MTRGGNVSEMGHPGRNDTEPFWPFFCKQLSDPNKMRLVEFERGEYQHS
jgi:hypothetical protein